MSACCLASDLAPTAQLGPLSVTSGHFDGILPVTPEIDLRPQGLIPERRTQRNSQSSTTLRIGWPGKTSPPVMPERKMEISAPRSKWKSARLDRNVRPIACAGIELARPADALYRA